LTRRPWGRSRTGRYHTNHPVDTLPPIPAAVRQRAERRLLAELRRLQRRSPLRDGVRQDVVVDGLLVTLDRRPVSHRGSGGLGLSAAQLRSILDLMVADGRISRRGHRLGLATNEEALDPEMAGRVERLLDQLTAAGAAPPPLRRLAAELGVPRGVLDQLRDAGLLRRLAPGIDLPAPALAALNRRLDQLGPEVSLSVAAVRDALGTSRRIANAILDARRRDAAERPRGATASGGPVEPIEGDVRQG